MHKEVTFLESAQKYYYISIVVYYHSKASTLLYLYVFIYFFAKQKYAINSVIRFMS